MYQEPRSWNTIEPMASYCWSLDIFLSEMSCIVPCTYNGHTYTKLNNIDTTLYMDLYVAHVSTLELDCQSS